eukprot:CAMPEP_0172001822 /NCGR_PEP_ID=MMETSP1041-20130122/3078_1 /TAXON_ID=464988 /ORGANISM="Hemiselmis andersenii, Strain CCMP439" /LENGTH=106 /DNA_ID=CAMNT_0012655495 /DNA_START=476 /DNA_END=793 /DNA_ORIENTATION=+
MARRRHPAALPRVRRAGRGRLLGPVPVHAPVLCQEVPRRLARPRAVVGVGAEPEGAQHPAHSVGPEPLPDLPVAHHARLRHPVDAEDGARLVREPAKNVDVLARGG